MDIKIKRKNGEVTYIVVDLLGQGANGIVYLVERDNKKFAMKVIDDKKSKEITLLETIGVKDNVVGSIEIVDLVDKRVGIIMTYIEGITLEQLIYSETDIPIPLIKHIMKQLVNGVKECHDSDVYHMDLKPSNIMIDKDANVFIVDFGSAMKKNTIVKAMTTTPNYLSNFIGPNIINKRSNSKAYKEYEIFKQDYFSIGCIMYELYARDTLFKYISVEQQRQNVTDFEKNNTVASLVQLNEDGPTDDENKIFKFILGAITNGEIDEESLNYINYHI